MWLDLDVDQSDGEGNRTTAPVSPMHVNMAEDCLLIKISTFYLSKKPQKSLPQSRVEGVGSGTPGCRPIMALQSSPGLTTHPDSLASVLL